MKILVKILAAVTFALTCSVADAHNRGGPGGVGPGRGRSGRVSPAPHVGITPPHALGHFSGGSHLGGPPPLAPGHLPPRFGHLPRHPWRVFDYGFYPWGWYGHAPYYGPHYSPSRSDYDGNSSLVVEVQSELASRGFYSGPIDGVIGPMTRDAIRGYQAECGFPATGFIDGKLLRSLGLS